MMTRNRICLFVLLMVWVGLAAGCLGVRRPEGDAAPPQLEKTTKLRGPFVGVPIDTVDDRTAAKAQPRAIAPAGLVGRIQGEWMGRSAADPDERWEWTITGARIDAKNTTGEYYKGTLAINSRVSPIRVDLDVTDSSDVNLRGEKIPGIMKIEGTALFFCFGDPDDGVRPTQFDPNAGILLVGRKR